MEPRLVALGALLLFVSSIAFVGAGAQAVATPLSLVSAATLALAAGSWAARRAEQHDPI
jgi:hypothetical protein